MSGSLSSPTCSVVIAAYNCAATVAAAIESVLAQSVHEFELFIVDDGSSDRTVEVVERYLDDGRVRLVRQANQGPAAARNAGIERASGAYVSMLDSDDLWLPNYLEAMTEALEADEAPGFAFTSAWILEGTTNRIRKRPWSPDVPPTDTATELFQRLIDRNFIWNSVTVRREVLADVRGYDPDPEVRGVEDYSLWLRLAAHGYGAVYVPGPLCIGRDLPESLSKGVRRMFTGDMRVYSKLLSSGSLPPKADGSMRARLDERRRWLELLDHPERRSLRLRARDGLARATHSWRAQRARRSYPPPEVARAFPGLGTGIEQERTEDEGDAIELLGRGLTRLVVRGASIASGGYAITQVISLATYLVLAHLLDPSQLGVFAAGSVLVSLGLVIGESGMLAALLRRRDRLEEAFNTAFLASLAAGFGLTVAGVAAAPIVGLVFGSFTIGLMSAVLSGSMFLRLVVIVPNARLQRNFSFMRRAVLDPLGTLLFAAGAVVGAVAGLGPWALVIGIYAQVLVDAVVSWALVRWRPRPRLASMSMWRELARFGRPVFGSNVIARATSQVPVIAVGRVLGTAALGQLSYALRVGMQPIAAVVDVGAYSLLPALARISHDPVRLRAGVLRTVRWASAIAFPVALLLIPLGTPAVVLVFGAKWLPAGRAVMALGLYCAALTFDSIGSETWKAAGRPELLPRMHGLSFVLAIVCVGAAVPFGITAVTAGMAAGAIGVAAYALWGIGHVTETPVRRYLAELWPPAVAAGVMAGVLYLTEHGLLHADRHAIPLGLALLALQTVLGAALYLTLLSGLSPACRRELATFARRTRGGPVALAR